MSLGEKKGIIQNVYHALERDSMDSFLYFFADDATLTLGPFKFEGKEEIRRWMAEFGQMFKKIKISGPKQSELSLNQKENKVSNEFIIETPLPNGSLGQLYCTGTFGFSNRKITHFDIEISNGLMLMKTLDAMRLFKT